MFTSDNIPDDIRFGTDNEILILHRCLYAIGCIRAFNHVDKHCEIHLRVLLLSQTKPNCFFISGAPNF